MSQSKSDGLSKQQVKILDRLYPDGIYCHNCGNRDIVLESDTEVYYCSKCGSSDSDE